jgi:predicted alpha/beta superfamily hydrolase
VVNVIDKKEAVIDFCGGIAMVKGIFLFLLFVLLASSVAAQEKAGEFKIGERFTIHSKTLNEDRSYLVYLPATYNSKQQVPKTYPVLYLLDGEAHFHSASGVVQFMSAGNIQIPELIIIAITNTDRTRDFTPTHSLRDSASKDQMTFPSSGGADNFLKFLQSELIPQVEATYRTLPYRILVGHSLAGAFAIHTLLSVPSAFQSIITIDPSLWWDNQVLLKRGKTFLAEAKGLRNTIFISLANHPYILDDPKPWEEAVKTFAGLIETNSSPRLRSKLQYFESEDHGSVPLQSLYNGLLFTFDGYKPSWSILLKQPSDITVHFQNVSERLGVELLPPEQFINTLGLILLNQMQEVDKAIEIFKLNVLNYPKSFNVYDSLAEAYMVKGDKSLAIKNYEKSLELNAENQNAKVQLEKLR